MSLQAILEAIRASGAARVREIEKETQTQIYAIQAEAQMEAAQIKEDSCVQVVAPAFAERARIIHRARLGALRTTGYCREELVDSALEQVRGRMVEMRSDQVYRRVLTHFVQEALVEIKGSHQDAACHNAAPGVRHVVAKGTSQIGENDGGQIGTNAAANILTTAGVDDHGAIQLVADPRDREPLEGILIDLWLDLPVSYELNCWGGLVARSEGGRVTIINTLEARLERATPYLRRYLAALFEEE